VKIALTGASGFVGSHVRKHFKDFVVIGRNDTEEEIVEKLKGVDTVINLAGAPIIVRWTESYKHVLASSRIVTTRKLVAAINKSDVKHFISTSAIGAYPDGGPYDESYSEYADDFLGKLTRKWEEVANKCEKPTTIVRFGVILGNDGGALSKMLRPFKFGLGGIIGNGMMMTSWIDIDDLIGIYDYIIENSLTGTFNATAPKPVRNYVFTKALGDALNRPTAFPIPEIFLKLLFAY